MRSADEDIISSACHPGLDPGSREYARLVIFTLDPCFRRDDKKENIKKAPETKSDEIRIPSGGPVIHLLQFFGVLSRWRAL